MSRSDIDDFTQVVEAESREVRRDLWQTLLSGVALSVPFLITALVFMWLLGLVTDALTPLVSVLTSLGPTSEMNTMIVEAIAFVIVFALIFLVGLTAQHGPNTTLARRIDALMADLPGVGSIYTSVDRMSEVIVRGDTDSFQEVKIVEFPRDDSFMLAFLTADSPPPIEDAAGNPDMLTVFVPMAPNPVMGGHLLNLPREDVYDVDLTVEEGMQAIMTTGMAIDTSVEAAD